MASSNEAQAEGHSFRLFDLLPPEIIDSVAGKLKKADRVRLAATCFALRRLSVRWFRSDVFYIRTDEPPAAQCLAWLCRVQAQLKLALGQSVHIVDSLTAGGACIVEVCMEDDNEEVDQLVLQLPVQLASLTQLTSLTLHGIEIEGGWQHLPPQLQELELTDCDLQQLPAQLAGLTQLRKLDLGSSYIEGGWQHLPQHLQMIYLDDCDLEQVPAQLAHLTQLTQLSLRSNEVEGGWQHLPRQLRELDLTDCSLEQIPAPLAGLKQLRKLSLCGNTWIEGGWQHLPPQLRKLDLYGCGLQEVPAELAGRRLTVVGMGA